MSRVPRLAVSFSGSGHLLIYQLGFARYLLNEPPARAWAASVCAFAGSSGGAIAATACALLGADELGDFADRSIRMGGFNALLETLRDVHSRDAPLEPPADGTLFIGATECRSGRAALFSRFSNLPPAGSARTTDETFRSAHHHLGNLSTLTQCILASCAIPRSAHPFDLLRSRPEPPPHRQTPSTARHEVQLPGIVIGDSRQGQVP